jgi:hypothetical protein
MKNAAPTRKPRVTAPERNSTMAYSDSKMKP